MVQTLYSFLEVAETASTSEIKAAYHQSLLKHHPDKAGQSDSSQNIDRAKRAYAVLSDSSQRAAYDRFLAEQRVRQAKGVPSDTVSRAELLESDSNGGSRLAEPDKFRRPMMTTSLLSQTEPKFIGATPSIDMQKVKILVLGEAGVGKTALCKTIVGTPVKHSPWTVGTSIEVIIHSYNAGTPQEMAYFVELWDIGGSRSHRAARRVFYEHINGIILVHDMTNRKSESNLRNWLAEVLQPDAPAGGSFNQSPMTYGLGANNSLPTSVFDGEQLIGNASAVPMLFVGSKLDQLQLNAVPPSPSPCSPAAASKSSPPKPALQSKLAQECNAEELWLDCRQPISPGSTNSVKLNRFFDKVVEKYEKAKQTSKSSVLTPVSHHTTMAERRRKLAFM